MGISVCSLSIESWGDRQLITVSLFTAVLLNFAEPLNTSPAWQQSQPIREVLFSGQQPQKLKHQTCVQGPFRRHQEPGARQMENVKMVSPGLLVSGEDCSQLLNICLIRSYPSGYRNSDMLIDLFHRNVGPFCLLPLDCVMGCNWLRTLLFVIAL